MKSDRHLLRYLLLMALTAALAVSLAASTTDTTRRRTVGAPVTGAQFDPSLKEAYLNDDGIAYIRPGLKIRIVSLTIPSDRKPVVEISLTDNFDQPLDRNGRVTPGAISVSFILAWYNPATRQYVSYTTRNVTTPATSPRPNVQTVQAAADSGGTWTDLAVGSARYRFNTALPANFDQAKTHTLGIYSSRNLTEQLGKSFYFNLEHDFRPDGQTVTDKWDKMRDAATCSNCHNPLMLHGGSRQDVKLCALCHTPQTIDPDTGETMDLKVMVHKIHRGHSLPSVVAGKPYIVIGNSQSVHDYSHIAYPQDIRNCDNCHKGTNPAATAIPAQADVWYTKPSAEACGSCHDDVNFTTGANHAAGAQINNDSCANCHRPQGDAEFDLSVKGAHVIPSKSSQMPGLTAQIISVTNVARGQKPTVVFAIKNGNGTAVNGKLLPTFSPILAGSTTSYNWYRRENAITTATYDEATGYTTYTFTNAIPADASGTWTISGDFRRSITLRRGDGSPDMSQQEGAPNPIRYVAVTGSMTPRRTVVTMTQCNACHDRLALHGEQRLAIEECVICHNPVESDVSRRPANAGQPESVSFQRMIHRIHTGEELTQNYTVYGFGGSENNYNEVLYPSDRRDCAKCHTANSFRLPVATNAGVVTTLRDYFAAQGPATASCLGCHDSTDAAAHAYLNTAFFPGSTAPSESCAACHGEGKEWAVEKVHAR